MQALSMIDMGAKAPESIAPAKSAEPKGKKFGKVLGDQHKPEKQQDTAVKQQPAEKKAVANAAKSEVRPVEKQGADKVGPVEKTQVQEPVDANVEPKVQHTVVSLLKAIADVTVSQAKGLEISQIETAEELGAMEDLLTDLVQQLDSADLQGEQVLAGIDLSALVEQLQMITEEGGEEQLAELVVQLEDQLAELVAQPQAQQAEETGLLINAELV
ncbi:MAG: hypothetical protein KAT20_08540, partial [Desulfuromonadales bacterium]|nr:hypothetical protein [Desulfuromonadales bacterium]